MESTKNLFDLWIDTQNKVVENWVESTKKFQEAAKNGDVLKHGTELYKQWFDNQKHIVDDMLKKTSEETVKAYPDFAKDWVHQNQELTSKWIDMMNKAVSAQSFVPENFLSESKKLYENWTSLYNKSFGNFGLENNGFKMPFFNGTQDFRPGQFSQDLYGNMMQASKTYMGMMEMWQPFFKLYSDNKFVPEEYFKWFNSEKYRELLGDMVGAMAPWMSKNYFEQVSNFMNNFRDFFRVFNFPSKDIYDFYSKLMPGMASYDFNTLHNTQQMFVEQMKKSYEPFLKLVPPSPSKEFGERLVKVQELLGLYQMKYAELQYLISQAGQKAMEHTVKHFFELGKEGHKLETYNQFFNYWVNSVEEKMLDVFNGDHFSRLQGELLSISLDIKIALEKNTEYALAAYPVVPRSEVDALTKQVYDLKSKLKALEKTLANEISEEENGKKGRKAAK